MPPTFQNWDKKYTPRPMKKQSRPNIEVSSRARAIQEQLKLNWPGMESSKELIFHQANIDFAEQLYSKLKGIFIRLRAEAISKDQVLSKKAGKPRTSSANWQLCNTISFLLGVMPGPVEMAVWWATEVNKIAWTWPNWKGKLMDWVLTMNDQLDMKMARHVADYCDDGQEWAAIRKLLKQSVKSPDKRK